MTTIGGTRRFRWPAAGMASTVCYQSISSVSTLSVGGVVFDRSFVYDVSRVHDDGRLLCAARTQLIIAGAYPTSSFDHHSVQDNDALVAFRQQAVVIVIIWWIWHPSLW